ncbi:MAG TPA: tRNA (N6-threonylcarbamoyladenosine(37)-N6)-methyltransferase TrmO [Tepidimicrobium sp.]|nr:tRNA (N6-threonylcarbamoyladenosine(37)-N6)-methyltransferase TrmO [Tepidimicrobium sp.]
MQLKQIGKISTPYKKKGQAPKQGRLSEEEGIIEVFPEYVDAMKGLKKPRHIIVLYWGDRADRSITQTIPPWGEELTGVFASRSPNRPNPIAFCACEIVDIQGNLIKVKGLDALDGSPLLDIKIYSYKVDVCEKPEGYEGNR